MAGDVLPSPDDPEAVRTVTKLVQYLRDATASTRQQALHLGQFDEVFWISELPEKVTLRDEPGQDARLLTVPLVRCPLGPPIPDELVDLVEDEAWNDPDTDESTLRDRVVEAGGEGVDDISVDTMLRKALADRQRWREADAKVSPVRALYDRFRSIAAKLEHRDDEYELVLSAGLIYGKAADRTEVCRHLLTQQLSVAVDKQSTAVNVMVNRDVRPQLEDRHFLAGVMGEHSVFAGPVRDELDVSAPLPHSKQAAKLLADWVDRVLPDSPRMSVDRRRPDGPPSGRMTVTLSPAIVFRRRDRTHVVAYFERMLEALQDPRTTIPLGLAQLLWDLDANQVRPSCRFRSRGGCRDVGPATSVVAGA